jgi:hypothetical protein
MSTNSAENEAGIGGLEEDVCSSPLMSFTNTAADLARSPKTLDRHLKLPELGLPRPVYIRGQRYFFAVEIAGYKRELLRQRAEIPIQHETEARRARKSE